MSTWPILSPSEVGTIADLSRLDVTEKECDALAADLGKTIEVIHILDEVDISGIPFPPHMSARTNIFREDVVVPSLSQRDVLSSSSHVHNGYFVVPAVFSHTD